MGSGSGKVILLGEHAVVYGAPAIVVGIDRGATARVWQSEAPSQLAIGGAFEVSAGETSDPAHAFASLLAACGVMTPVRVEAMTELPAAAGLGCSAALAVAIVRALDSFLGRPVAIPSEVARRAMSWERVFHGNPSGVDAAAASRGGCIFYQQEAIEEVRLRAPLTLAVGHSGMASSTRAMVEHVARLNDKKRALVERTVQAIESLVRNARLALEAGDQVGLGRLMDLNQMLLSGLMLSTEEIETMCRVAREEGALGAKLTGSGGGGCVVALVAGDAEPILARWAKEGFQSFASRVLPSVALGTVSWQAP
jgi:mevalonate kinase